MSQPLIPLDEFDMEMAATRRTLERVPTERGEWKPHEKSFPLGHLAQLVASLPGWIAMSLRGTELDFQKSDFHYSFEPTEKLLTVLDEAARESRRALEEVTGEALDAEWTLRNGEQVLYRAPRRTVVRQHVSHLVHHRAQLGVYLRLLDLPVPSIYGPSADER